MIGMVGYPNVGKSSTINALFGRKRVAVSATPGKTKHFQTILLENSNITMCDCPGLVFPSFMITKSEMVCNGLLRVDEMKEIYGPTSIICRRIPSVVLETLYGIILPKPQPTEDQDRPPFPEELLTAYAYVRGFMTSHGMPDKHRASRIIIKDFVDGKLLYCHPPIGLSSTEFNPVPKLKKPIKIKEIVEDVETVDNTLEIKSFDLEGEDNPNNRQKRARGKKYQRRLKQQQKLSSNMYNAGRNPLMHQGQHSSVPGSSLPTNIKLEKN
jgi:ribosome biogenesis GTPase A